MRSDALGLFIFLSSDAGPLCAGRRVAGAPLHNSARLWARRLLPLGAGQRHHRPCVQPVHLDALCELAPAACSAPRRVEQSGSSTVGRRYLFVMPDCAGVSRATSPAPTSVPVCPPSASRQPVAAATHLHAALPRALRYTAHPGRGSDARSGQQTWQSYCSSPWAACCLACGRCFWFRCRS
jgi:hypothetical protein